MNGCLQRMIHVHGQVIKTDLDYWNACFSSVGKALKFLVAYFALVLVILHFDVISPFSKTS